MERVINTEREVSKDVTFNVNTCPVSPSVQSKAKIILLKITGVFCVGLAILGAVLPVLPTTVFLIMAAACFAKSSPRMQKKLLANKTFGPLIHDWQKYRSIPRKAKRIALLSIILSVCWSAFMLQSALLTGLVVALVIGPFIFLVRLPLSK
ncbi:YbaN family protein [Colwellia sp. TT2012]|uniref:YbaN family protein n=1 Tax=Colwellia sp. TT2012 TaxID=1720342 RepID=UPI0009EC118B|nr:YbaN family protein [Colwellia sp. TT2012]